MLQPGTTAPDFSLPDADMEMRKLSKLRGRVVVVYFYPKDDTPGCTVEAIEFSDLEDEFVKLNASIIGISKDDCISHAAFRDKHGLAVDLLADVDGKVCEKYGVRRMGIMRSTFVVDREGILRHVQYGVTAKGHAAEILTIVKQIV